MLFKKHNILSKEVKYIDSYAFYNCEYLIIYTENESIPVGWEKNWNQFQSGNGIIYYGINNENFFEENGLLFIIENNEAKLTSYVGSQRNVIIPSIIKKNGKTYRVTSIGEHAFSRYNLNYIFIPNSIEKIYYNSFIGCNNLIIFTEINKKPNDWDYNWNYGLPVKWGVNQNVIYEYNNLQFILNGDEEVVAGLLKGKTSFTIPSNISINGKNHNVVGIVNNAFSNCIALKYITLPDSLSFIGSNAFYNCKKFIKY